MGPQRTRPHMTETFQELVEVSHVVSLHFGGARMAHSIHQSVQYCPPAPALTKEYEMSLAGFQLFSSAYELYMSSSRPMNYIWPQIESSR